MKSTRVVTVSAEKVKLSAEKVEKSADRLRSILVWILRGIVSAVASYFALQYLPQLIAMFT
ncbi:MAG: hypothetical protein ACTSV7_09205 [Candidatus Baldrarchaeia archaeon]